MDDFNIVCPYCDGAVQIKRKDLNCRVFRHGVHTITNIGINPHMTESAVELMIQNNLLRGCGKQFIFDGKTTQKVTGR